MARYNTLCIALQGVFLLPLVQGVTQILLILSLFCHFCITFASENLTSYGNYNTTKETIKGRAHFVVS